MDICDKCVTNKDECKLCKHAPQYRDYPTTSKFKDYSPTCLLGHSDCVNDPAYIQKHHPRWYKELYGDKEPYEVLCTDDKCFYDDEDK